MAMREAVKKVLLTATSCGPRFSISEAMANEDGDEDGDKAVRLAVKEEDRLPLRSRVHQLF